MSRSFWLRFFFFFSISVFWKFWRCIFFPLLLLLLQLLTTINGIADYYIQRITLQSTNSLVISTMPFTEEIMLGPVHWQSRHLVNLLDNKETSAAAWLERAKSNYYLTALFLMIMTPLNVFEDNNEVSIITNLESAHIFGTRRIGVSNSNLFSVFNNTTSGAIDLSW